MQVRGEKNLKDNHTIYLSIELSLRGGIQHKMGIFVADVQPGTLADKVGLQVIRWDH